MIDLKGMILRPEYQQPIHDMSIEHCRNSKSAVVVSASVGAGKTLNIAAMAKHAQEKGGKVLVLARQGELIEQNSKMAWKCGLKNSVYSASLGVKSTFYPVVMGTEGTVSGALESEFSSSKFDLLLIDECHHVDPIDLIMCLKKQKPIEDASQYTKIIIHFMINNPKMRIIGYTGSPYRGTTDIIGEFWTEKIYDVSTMYLIGLGYLVPVTFGFGDDTHKYDLSEWKPDQNANGTGDYSAKDLAAMSRKITKEDQLTSIIIEEVIERTKNRNGVMITCAGKKHCEQVASFLPVDSWAIITDATSPKKRRQYLIDAREGKIKFIIQIGCLTTGVNVPTWDTSVLLRRVGSLTLLTQLIGRVLRILEPEDTDRGFVKHDALILDYTDTFDSFGDIYEDPMLDKARAFKSTITGETQECLECQTPNSMYAVRCVGGSDTEEDHRCGNYFKFAMCFKCTTKNSPSASTCRNCDAIMIDPANALKNKAYSDDDFKKVLYMDWEKAKGAGLWVKFGLDCIYTKNGIESQEVAKEFYDPFSNEQHKKGRWRAFLASHINCYKWRSVAEGKRNVDEIIHSKVMFDVPTHITHRVNDKGFSIVARRKYLSGRETK